MPTCSVKKCKNYVLRKGMAKRNRLEQTGKWRKITYHRFPKDPVRRRDWARILRMENIKDTCHICSDHFPEDAFDRTSLAVVRLREHALPIEGSDEEEGGITLGTGRTSNVNELTSASSSCNEHLKTCEQKSIGVQTDDNTNSPRRRYVNQETSVSPERVFRSPTKELMRKCFNKEIELLRKKNKSLSQRLRRVERRFTCVVRVEKIEKKKVSVE
ncbi:THAP domain-containing protein 2 [Orussus abietinus]|uniref:THAP domain-containing protein 2 n=1 Tax=Orussus abietinus TaxID=222816 RepID=UPI0006267A33|nr:THAP domain-containing protein 2 [Orussus abietinus]